MPVLLDFNSDFGWSYNIGKPTLAIPCYNQDNGRGVVPMYLAQYTRNHPIRKFVDYLRRIGCIEILIRDVEKISYERKENMSWDDDIQNIRYFGFVLPPAWTFGRSDNVYSSFIFDNYIIEFDFTYGNRLSEIGVSGYVYNPYLSYGKYGTDLSFATYLFIRYCKELTSVNNFNIGYYLNPDNM